MIKMVNHCGDGFVIGSEECFLEAVVVNHYDKWVMILEEQDIWVEEEENMKKMVMIKKIDDLNNEKDEKKWQSMELEMKIEEIMCSKREIPAIV
ncbi:hypothetical protein Tco_1220656 [Tanacetum coccineum]